MVTKRLRLESRVSLYIKVDDEIERKSFRISSIILD